MISYGIYPKHLNQGVFVKMVKYLRDTRVECKHTSDSERLVVPGVPNKIAAEALKIVINSIYGKFGSDRFFLYDRMAQLQVTINGQLMTMTLVEELELNGIHVISANTDGIVIKLPRNKWDVYKDITDRWNETNKMGADYETYKLLIARDINNYFDVQENGKQEYKGALDPKQYIKDLTKGYDMPIVAKAVFEYFVNNKPVMETLTSHTNILDFCKTQNIGQQFEAVEYKIENGKIVKNHIQRYVRFYVSTNGTVVKKQNKVTGSGTELAAKRKVTILNTLDDKPISERNINYKYYYDAVYTIINPIKLGISPTTKANAIKGTKSGKALIKKYSHDFLTLFDDEELNND